MNSNNPIQHQNANTSLLAKNKTLLLVLCIFLGGTGIHRFIVHKYKSALIYLFTGGLLGFGWLYDIIMICCNKFAGLDAKPTNNVTITSMHTAKPQPSIISEPTSTNNLSSEKALINNDTTLTEQSALPSDVYGAPRTYLYNDVNVCIIRGQEPDYNMLHLNDIVVLTKEPTNPYDNTAILLSTSNNIKIGYLYRGKLKDMANDYLSTGQPVRACISNITSDGKIQIQLAFYHCPTHQSNTLFFDNSISFRLSSSTKDMQDNIENCLSEDDDLELEYDYDKEKYYFYLTYDDCVIGYAPKKHLDLLEKIFENDINYHATVDTIEENDNGKYLVDITFEYDDITE